MLVSFTPLRGGEHYPALGFCIENVIQQRILLNKQQIRIDKKGS